jgi:hypothetical protein
VIVVVIVVVIVIVDAVAVEIFMALVCGTAAWGFPQTFRATALSRVRPLLLISRIRPWHCDSLEQRGGRPRSL